MNNGEGGVTPPPMQHQHHHHHHHHHHQQQQGEEGHRPITENPPSRTLWLGGITTAHSEDALWKFFEKFGTLDCVKILYAKNIAFVNFMDIPSAQRAKGVLENEMVCGVKLQHNFGKGSAPPGQPTGKASLGEHEYPSNIVWIGGLQIPPLTERFLVELFSGFPGLVNVVVYEDKKIAFINFVGIQYATVARNTLIGKPLAGVPVKVCYGKPPASAPQQKAMGSDNPTTYMLRPLQQPIDYYMDCAHPDALTEREIEDLLDQIRAYNPQEPDNILKTVSWVLRRTHKIKDICKILEIRMQDKYLHQTGKRLQALYMFFALMKRAKEDPEHSDILGVLSRGGYVSRLAKVLCWNQSTDGVGFISQVFAGAFEARTITDAEFLGLSSFIKGDQELQMLRMAYNVDPTRPPGWMGAPTSAATAAGGRHVAVRPDSDSESSSEARRRRKKRRDDRRDRDRDHGRGDRDRGDKDNRDRGDGYGKSYGRDRDRGGRDFGRR